jgi:hypothetical protein
VLGAALVAGMPCPVAAAPPVESPTVGVLPTGFSGELPEDWIEGLQSRLAEGLRRGDFEVAVAASAEGAATCAKPECRAKISRAIGAGYLARLQVDKQDTDYAITVELFGSDGRRLVIAAGSCEVCGIAEVQSVVADQAALVRGKLEALSRGRPKLRFVSRPESAKLFVDGQLMGSTPVTTETDAGIHRVKAERKGYVALEREITAVAGTEETVVLDLQPVPRSQRFMPWGVGSLIVGAMAGIAGGTLLAIHERPFGRACTGNDVDADGDCRLVYDTMAAGASLAAGGAALLVVGAVLLGVSRRDQKNATETRVQAHAGGLHVRF